MHTANDDVARLYGEACTGDGNALSGSGLASNGNIAIAQVDRAVEIDRAANIEDNDARTSYILDCPTQGTRAVIVEIGDMDNLATATTCSFGAISLHTFKTACHSSVPFLPIERWQISTDGTGK